MCAFWMVSFYLRKYVWFLFDTSRPWPFHGLIFVKWYPISQLSIGLNYSFWFKVFTTFFQYESLWLETFHWQWTPKSVNTADWSAKCPNNGRKKNQSTLWRNKRKNIKYRMKIGKMSLTKRTKLKFTLHRIVDEIAVD